MKSLISVVLGFTSFLCSCSPNQEIKEKKREVVATEQKATKAVEDFDTFYQKFRKDKKFRNSRTVLPFIYKMTDDKNNSVTKKINEFPINPDAKTWKEKVIFEFSDKSKSPIILSIGIEDTGYLIEVKFDVNEDGNWYAIDAENLSD